LSANVIEIEVDSPTRRVPGAGAVRLTVGVPPTSGTTVTVTEAGEDTWPSASRDVAVSVKGVSTETAGAEKTTEKAVAVALLD
jgi:hypothetical protein